MLISFQLLSVTRDFPSVLTDLRFVPSDFCSARTVPEILAQLFAVSLDLVAVALELPTIAANFIAPVVIC
jgi:hypothetical protein